MELSIVSRNRLAQFSARFEARDDGSFLYFHPDGENGGLPCTREEVESLIREHAETHERSMRSAVYWVIGCGITLGLLEASHTATLPRWAQFAVLLLPVMFTLPTWQHASLRPLRFLEGRIPAAPSRGPSPASHLRLAALPASLIALMLLPAAGLAYHATRTGWEITNLLIVASNVLLATAWLRARRRRK